MRLLFLGFSSPVAGLEATGRKLAQERLGLKVSICGEKFPLGRSGLANDADSPPDAGNNRGLLPITSGKTCWFNGHQK